MLHKGDDTTLKIKFNKDTITEIRVMAIRKDVEPRDIVSYIVDQYVNKHKDKSNNVT